jgi:hypothetical protein
MGVASISDKKIMAQEIHIHEAGIQKRTLANRMVSSHFLQHIVFAERTTIETVAFKHKY